MAIIAEYISKTVFSGQNEIIDNVRAMIVAIDDAVDTSDALILARAVTVANANGIPLADGYFDTIVPIAATYNAADDFTIYDGKAIAEVIA